MGLSFLGIQMKTDLFQSCAAEARRLQRTAQKRAMRSYASPTVRGSDRERQVATAQGQQLRGASPRLRSWAVAEKSYHKPQFRSGGREEQPHVQGVAASWAQEGREELPHIQGVAASWAQEGREELPHVQGQEGRPWEGTPRPR